jgi:hypothetical protein
MADPQLTREDVVSAVGARHELGRDLEPEVIDAFLDRVERGIDARVDRRLAEHRPERAQRSRRSGGRSEGLALAIVSLGTGIPITAIAGEMGGLPGLIAAWAGIVGVNVVFGREHGSGG